MREVNRNTSTHPDLPRANSLINDNQCITMLQGGLLAGSPLVPRQTMNFLKLNVNCHVAKPVHTAPGLSQKKELSPGLADYLSENKLKYVKGASCVTQLSCVKPVTNVKNVASTLPVGAKLQNYWQTWLDLGAGPKVVQILKEGYTLPFRIQPKLTRSPTVISCYVHPHRNLYLLEALHQLIDKNAVELVQNQTSLGFFNRLFLVPKPNNKWRPILDLKRLNLFLKAEKFKTETPGNHQNIPPTRAMGHLNRLQGHLLPYTNTGTIQEIFHVQGQTYQFKALPFSLSTAPLEFTVVAKEVKLMAVHKGVRIHQYLDNWLVRARSHQDRWQNVQDKILEIRSLPACPVWQFMSLIGLLTTTEKQVHLGRLHMRPIQWHLKNNWRVPESLEKVIPIPRSLHPHLQWWLK